MKRIFAIMFTLVFLISVFSGCGEKTESKSGKVYYLNFKPEQDSAWQELAREYTAETGVNVKVLTAAEGTYEQTLTSEIEKTDAPTLFQVSGSVALETWDDRCMDMKNTEVYKQLTSDDFALKNGDKVSAVAYVYEGYGLIVNKALLGKAGYSEKDITDFDSLKRISEDITKRKGELGFSAFTSSGLDSSSSWRFSGHLANLPLYYEFEEDKIKSQPATVKGTYLDNFKAVWDLYINNATCKPTEISTKTSDDALAEFKTGKAVFYQNGTWEYENIKTIGDENIGYLPIYFGVNDKDEGLCCGTENYWAINKNAPEADRKATEEFLAWVVTSEKGTKALAEKMDFVSPFKSAKPTSNVLANIMNEYAKEGKYNVYWAFNYTPGVDDWRADIVSALNAYSAGKSDFGAVKTAFVDGWAEQYKKSHP